MWWRIISLLLALVLTEGPGVGGALKTGFYADNGLQQTVMVEKTGRQRKDVKQEILTLLGLHHRPKPIDPWSDTAAPQFMMNLYENLHGEGGNTPNSPLMHLNLSSLHGVQNNVGEADVIMSFVNHAHRDRRFRHEGERRFWFDFSEVAATERLTGAELRLFKTAAKQDSKPVTYRLELFSIRQGHDLEDRYLELETNQTVYSGYEGWLELNATSSASEWAYMPSLNLGLYLQITDLSNDRDIKPRDAGIVGKRGSDDKQPFLVGFFRADQKIHVRKARAARRSRSGYNKRANYYALSRPRNVGACQMRSLYVSFRELGWQDWIIAPEGYAAYYCEGECAFPLNSYMNATNHAIVQTLVHLMKPSDVPAACCAPTKLSAISVLYFDDSSNVILKKYRNMVVRSCGCH